MRNGYSKSWGDRLKRVREIGSWTQTYLGDRIGMCQVNICQIEANRRAVSKRFMISVRALIDFERKYNEDLAAADSYWPTMEELLGNEFIIEEGDPE